MNEWMNVFYLFLLLGFRLNIRYLLKYLRDTSLLSIELPHGMIRVVFEWNEYHFEIRPLLTQEFLSGGWNNQIKQNDWNSLRLFYTYWFVYCGIYIIILVHRWGFCEWSSQKRVDKNQFHFKRKEKLPNTTYKIHTQLHTHIQIRFDLIQFNLLRWIYRTVQKVWTEIGQPIGF